MNIQSNTSDQGTLHEEILHKMMYAFASYQKQMVRDRMLQGRRMTATPPLGLRRRSDGTVEVDPAGWATVERAFKLAAQIPASRRALSRKLSNEGMEVSVRKLVGLLSNRGYVTGDFDLPYGGSATVKLDRPIPPELFAEVGDWLTKR